MTFLCLLGARELWLQQRDARFVRDVALAAVRGIPATDSKGRVLALCEYVRAHVSAKGVPGEGRPFLRATAKEILATGRGYCGEATRAFIALASELGIAAQRLNLVATFSHVVADVELDGQRLIVDPSQSSELAGLLPLRDLTRATRFQDYTTLNVRRLRLAWLVPRIKVRLGRLTYWLENPHALKGLLWLALAALLGLGAAPKLFAKARRATAGPVG